MMQHVTAFKMYRLERFQSITQLTVLLSQNFVFKYPQIILQIYYTTIRGSARSLANKKSSTQVPALWCACKYA